MLRIFVITVLLVLAMGGLHAQDGDPAQEMDPESPYDNVQVLARAMQLIRQDYVDDGKISYRDLTYSALRGMLAELDPHSQVMEPRDCRGMQEDTKSEFGGLGVVVCRSGGRPTSQVHDNHLGLPRRCC
jgi:carboxyl-terminal processing protease